MNAKREPVDYSQITLLYFASVKTSLPDEPLSEQITLPQGQATIILTELRSYLIDQVHPHNQEYHLALNKSVWSVDEEIIPVEQEATTVLKGGETLCPIPPVSGG